MPAVASIGCADLLPPGSLEDENLSSCVLEQLRYSLQCEEHQKCPLPMEKLSSRAESILWYQQLDLFEDDLSDCGISRVSVRVRVMPEFWFVLLRHEVRVDSVLIRKMDTRLYHEFGADHVLREFTWAEAPFDTLKERCGDKLDPGAGYITSDSVGTGLLDLVEDVRQREMQKLFLCAATTTDEQPL
eukprot:GHVS01051521.1.p2 GENE.GHVS01051521.1~~GHVS01051521.1.p2  ORF type:complete len:187 (+),score=30.70 GHVS01051521.1:479-1039(+)